MIRAEHVIRAEQSAHTHVEQIKAASLWSVVVGASDRCHLVCAEGMMVSVHPHVHRGFVMPQQLNCPIKSPGTARSPEPLRRGRTTAGVCAVVFH